MFVCVFVGTRTSVMRSAVEVATLQLEDAEKELMLGESLRPAVATTKSLY